LRFFFSLLCQRVTNFLVVAFLFLLIIMVSIATGIMSTTWNSAEIKGSWYIPFANGLTAQQTVLQTHIHTHTDTHTDTHTHTHTHTHAQVEGFITILILLNNYVPISLYVSMEANILESTFDIAFIHRILLGH